MSNTQGKSTSLYYLLSGFCVGYNEGLEGQGSGVLLNTFTFFLAKHYCVMQSNLGGECFCHKYEQN